MDDLYLQIYENRLLVFLETSPQSNQYQQVLLNTDQFKKVSDAIVKSETKDEEIGMLISEVDISEEVYQLPDLQSING